MKKNRTEDLKAFPDQLVQDRNAAGLTQVGLAVKLGFSPSAVQKWEGGRGVPNKAQRQILCEFFAWPGIFISVDSEPTETRPGSSVLAKMVSGFGTRGVALAPAF